MLLATTTATTSFTSSSTTTTADAAASAVVVVAFTRLGATWEQTDVLRCPECGCPGGEDGTGKGSGCFGASLTLHDDLAAVRVLFLLLLLSPPRCR